MFLIKIIARSQSNVVQSAQVSPKRELERCTGDDRKTLYIVIVFQSDLCILLLLLYTIATMHCVCGSQMGKGVFTTLTMNTVTGGRLEWENWPLVGSQKSFRCAELLRSLLAWSIVVAFLALCFIENLKKIQTY